MIWLRGKNREDPLPVLVYQMGKVGSLSVMKSLERYRNGVPALHLHYLSENRISDVLKRWKGHVPRHIQNSLHVRRLMDQHRSHLWKIISLTREPVGRNISAFFENLRHYQSEGNVKELVECEDTAALKEIFLSRYPHDEPLKWFDEEMNRFFGINVFSEIFDSEKGYHRYRAERADVLVIRLEDLHGCAQRAFLEFLGLEYFTVDRQNVAEDKDYASVYQRFINTVTFSPAYLDSMYNSRYARYFYHDRLKGLRTRWTEKGGTGYRSGEAQYGHAW